MRTFGCLSLLLAACGEPSVVPQPVQPVDPVAAAPTPAPAPTEVAPDQPVRRLATVLEVLPGGDRYTYARMDACGSDAWVAGPIAELEVGQTLEMEGGVGMTDFKSDTHDRVFPMLLMVDAWRLAEKPLDCAAVPAPSGTPVAPEDLARMEFGVATATDIGAGYTFVELEHCGVKRWYSGPETPVKKGDLVSVKVNSVMKDFYVKSLEKKFPEIRFAQKFQKANLLPPCEGPR